MRFRKQYKMTERFGSWLHEWTVECAHGIAHLHITEPPSDSDRDREALGGIEMHYRHPPKHREDDAPDHQKCSVMGCPCWHDGSTMAAERAVTRLVGAGFVPDHDAMFGEVSSFLGGILADIREGAEEVSQ